MCGGNLLERYKLINTLIVKIHSPLDHSVGRRGTELCTDNPGLLFS